MMVRGCYCIKSRRALALELIMCLIALTLVSIILNSHLCVCRSVCPNKCVCDYGAAVQSVQCFQVQAVPSGISTETRRLNLAHNNLREIKGPDLSSLTVLEEVILLSSGLEAVDSNVFRAQSKLQRLDLQKNRLRLFPRGLPSSLDTLKVGHNRIHALQESALENLKDLRRLDLRSNHIASLRAGVFSALAKLEYLNLDDNQIGAVQGSLQLAQLNLLSLEGNRIPSFPSSFFASLASLITLRLSGNLLTRVPQDLPGSLAVLDLHRNQIRSLRHREMGQLRDLASLSAAANRLASVDGALRLPRLTSLDVSGNLLRALPGRLSPLLERLDCRQNALREVSFPQLSGMRRLRHLFLENNTVGSFEANALRNNVLLTNLALEQNLLSAIPDGLPESLIRLDLKGNSISVIHDRQLRPLRRLQVLNLRSNLLTSLPGGLGGLLPRLGALLLEGNPWNCTCELRAQGRALAARGVAVPRDEELCSGTPVGAPPGGGGAEWQAYLTGDRCEEAEEDVMREGQDMDIMDYEDYYDYDK